MIRVLCLVLLGLLVSCNQHASTGTTVENPATAHAAQPLPKDNFKAGEIIASVPVRMDIRQTFALYLPKGYTDTSKLPVIIFFDPHADGSLPLNLYQNLADKYHYILIGSNTSKNGTPLQELQAIAYNLFNEAKTRLSVNPDKITYCGFSGGAKVALLSAESNTAITNVIYCGAKVDITPAHPLTLIGFAGVRDMNYTDLVTFDQSLAKTPIKHYLVEWKGKHEFPTADVFNDAFVFLNTGKIDNYDSKKPTITDAQLKREQDKKTEYVQAFNNRDLDWWKKEIANLNANKKKDIMDERLLAWLSLAGYSIGGGQLVEGKLDMAEKILAIYKMADPENKDCDSMINVLNQKKGMMTGPK